MKYYIGIDLGGMSAKGAIFGEDGALIVKKSVVTQPEDGFEGTVDKMAGLCKELAAAAKTSMKNVEAIGMAVPGYIDVATGVVVRWANFGWAKVPLGEKMKEKTGVATIKMSNDANVAALGEAKFGAGKDYGSCLMVTLGTGVGGGIIIDGKIYAGMRSMGAELGHTLLVLEGEHCTCGRDGCWEAYASATALIRQAKRAGEQHPESALHGREELTALDVFQAADAGDAAAQAVIDRWCVYVAAGMTDLVNSLAPEMILIGGGISRQGERILSPIREYVAEHCFGGREGAVPIIAAAKLGNEAGIIGAAAL